MRTVAIVQARLTSSRLPGKVMFPLAGEPVIRHVLKRALAIEGIDHVICAVPDDARSRPIAEEARSLGCGVFHGAEADVLFRFAEAARHAEAGRIVRITADCPLLDPERAAAVLALLRDPVEYASNVWPRSVPPGLDCEAFTRDALNRASAHAETPHDREHVTPWMQRRLRTAAPAGNLEAGVRLCLDTAEDYAMLKARLDATD